MGGASQFMGGGGFVAGGSPTTAAAAGGARGGAGGRPHTMTPMTIKSLSSCAGEADANDKLFLHGLEITNISLVAKVVSAEKGGSYNGYTVNDGTGQCEVKHWLDDETTSPASEGSYVHIYGTYKSSNNNSSFVAHGVREVTDSNEITFHLMECMFVDAHLKKSAGMLPVGGDAGVAPTAPYGGDVKPQVVAEQMGGLNDLQTRLMGFFNSDRSDNGLSVSSLLHNVPMYNEMQVREAVETLMLQGNIYSTIDDNHFKSTSA